MTGTNLILHEEEHRRITGLGEKLLNEANAQLVALIDRNGQPMAWAGELPDVDRTALASLTAGNVAATEGLARMIGEPTFASLYHEGESGHLHISSVGTVGILLVAFDERSSLGLVRLRVRQITPDIEAALDKMLARSEESSADPNASPLEEITDEDIDKLFFDSL